LTGWKKQFRKESQRALASRCIGELIWNKSLKKSSAEGRVIEVVTQYTIGKKST